MVKIIGQQNNPMDAVAQVMAGFGQSVFGDQVGSALKRSQMQQAQAQAEATARANQYNQSYMDRLRRGETNSNDALADAFGAGVDPKDLGGYNLFRTANQFGATDPNTDAARAAAGMSANDLQSTVIAKDATARRGQDITAATSRQNNADNNAMRWQIARTKPLEGMDANGQPSLYQLGPNGEIPTGMTPMPKSGMTITTNPDGTMTMTQGGVGAGAKPTEQQIRASGIAQEMMPGIAILNQMYSGNKTMSNSGVAAISLPGAGTPLGQNIAQGVGAISPDDQMILGAMESVMNNLYIKTGAARAASEDRNELMSMIPLSTDTPERRELKRAMFNQKAMAVIFASRDPQVRAQLLDAISGNFQPAYPGARPLGNPTSPPAPTQPAPQAPVPPNAPAGAKQAPDGNWYIPDPQRPGRYLQVVQ